MTPNLGDLCKPWIATSGQAEKVALRLVGPDLSAKDYTFADLDRQACRFANVFSHLGIRDGKVVSIFMPKCLEVFTGFLGALKARAVVLPLFSNFGDLALVDRLADCAAACVITKRSMLPRLQRVREQLPALRTILLVDGDADVAPDVLALQPLLARAKDEFATLPVDADTRSLLHYTSGSTGKPKGVVHVHAAAEHIRLTAREIFQFRPDDIFWCTADHGWVTGTSYGIFAPWFEGITQVQYTGAFGADRWFQILQDRKVNVWYTAPTALRMLMRADDVDFTSFDLSALRSIYSVGEPLNPQINRWSLSTIGRDIHDTWFQTETGGIMISNRPGLAIRPGSMGKPLSTIHAEIVDDAGKPCAPGVTGHLCVRYPWPSMFRDYLNRTDTYKAKFSAEYYDSGDMATKDADGYFWFAARNDDVINTAGHLVSPFEVESALLELPEVAESGVVGAPDPILFEKIVVFAALRQGIEPSDELRLKIRLHVSNRLSTAATPQDIVFVPAIPKNKSGKILRRVLRARYLGEDPGDVSTMEEQP